MLRMDQVHVIRHKVLQEGRSIRSVAREMGFSRNTIRKYLRVSEPVRRESGPRAQPVMAKVAPRIDQLLEEWKGRTRPPSKESRGPVFTAGWSRKVTRWELPRSGAICGRGVGRSRKSSFHWCGGPGMRPRWIFSRSRSIVPE